MNSATMNQAGFATCVPGTVVPFESISVPGCYICNWSGHLIRVPENGIAAGRQTAYNIIGQVGNYGEIFDRNLTELGIERGINALWTDGGLQYAPPYR